jgi:hypothetical protein
VAEVDKVEVQVVVHDPGPEELQQAMNALRDAGMEITDVTGELGLVLGHTEPSKLGSLRKIEGVSVETARELRIPPPESPLQ